MHTRIVIFQNGHRNRLSAMIFDEDVCGATDLPIPKKDIVFDAIVTKSANPKSDMILLLSWGKAALDRSEDKKIFELVKLDDLQH